MLKRLYMVLSVVAALGLGLALVAPTPVDAKPQNQNQNKNVKVNKNIQVNKNVQVQKNFKGNKFVVGKSYNGHMWYGRNRHRWHGAWYEYGVGSCWINVDGLWFWNVVACP
jgi:hypothetical protein